VEKKGERLLTPRDWEKPPLIHGTPSSEILLTPKYFWEARKMSTLILG